MSSGMYKLPSISSDTYNRLMEEYKGLPYRHERRPYLGWLKRQRDRGNLRFTDELPTRLGARDSKEIGCEYLPAMARSRFPGETAHAAACYLVSYGPYKYYLCALCATLSVFAGKPSREIG